jgi:hypothetical protein
MYTSFQEGEMKDCAEKTKMFTEIKEVYDDGNYVLYLTRGP